MRRPLLALGALVLLIAAAVAAYVLGVGPLAPPTAPLSVVFVAISRSTDETDAHEIEAIDLAAGTRELFDAGGRISALAVSPDRRSLYAALDGGKVVLLDATTGSTFGTVDLEGLAIVSLVPTTDGRTLFAVAVTNVQSAVIPIDLAAKRAGEPITFAMTAGVAALQGSSLVVPLGDPQRLQVAFIDTGTRTVTSRLSLPRGSLIAPAAFAMSATQTGVLAFDGGLGAGATGLRVYIVTDPLHWSDVGLQAPFPQGLSRGQVAIGLQAATAADGTIHVCLTAGAAARRYVVAADRRGAVAGADCGPLAGGAEVVMAKRDPARLLVLDGDSGRTLRTLPLAGVPARIAH